MRLGPSVLGLAALAWSGCDAPPPAAPGGGGGGGGLDGGPDGGAIPVDAGGGGGPGRRDGGPVLPPADVEIALPFGGGDVPLEIEVAAALGALDVQLHVDTTSSISDEIETLQDTLVDVVLPGLRARVPDTSFGVSRFADFPGEPYGGPDDVPFALVTPITSNTGRVATAVASLNRPLDFGGDPPEAAAEALWQVATGEGYAGGGVRIAPFAGAAAVGGGVGGGVGFREGALRTVLLITDAATHEPDDYGADFPGTRDVGEAIEALAGEGIRVLGVASHPAARTWLDRVAIETGAVIPADGAGTCPTGRDGIRRAAVDGVCPLVFDVDATGAGLDGAILDAFAGLVSGLAFDTASGVVEGDRLGFVRRVRAARATVPDGAPAPDIADVDPVDGVPESFVRVPSGARLVFAFDLRNDVIRATDAPQAFRLTVRVTGDGLELARRVVRVVVPPGSDR